MITDELLERAMTFLAESDIECAELKANVARSEYLAKVGESLAYTLASARKTLNVEGCKAEARTSQTVMDAWEKHFSAVKAYEVMRARRERAVLTVEVWRSQNANRRQAA